MKRMIALLAVYVLLVGAASADESGFKVGFAKRDITPTAAMPMWGYGARHDLLSTGVVDPLMAKAIVIEAGGDRLAIVGTDIGRGPTKWMMEKIRKEVEEKANVKTVMISGSHSHHGPVIELTDQEGFGKGKFDAGVAYAKRLPELLIEAIVEAAGNLQPAKMGIATKNIEMNRNRHTKQAERPVDPMLAVLRFDKADDGKPLAILVNFAAHPVTMDTMVLKFSPDYPGAMQDHVERGMGTNCFFMQGASGDLSINADGKKTKEIGVALGDQVLALAQSIETKVPEKPSIKTKVNRFNFSSRVNFKNPIVVNAFKRAFFPELIPNFMAEMQDGVQPELNTVLLNGDLALVGGSGEFFCNHSNRLKKRAYVPNTLFFGYCNGHHMYFPTIEAASEGGYGGDATVSPVQVGAGEIMMDQALINLYTMLGKFPPEYANDKSLVTK